MVHKLKDKFEVFKEPDINFWHATGSSYDKPLLTKEEALKERKRLWKVYHHRTVVFKDDGEYRVFMQR